jgi:hypothetical protein
VKGIQNFQIEPAPLQTGDNHQNAKFGWVFFSSPDLKAQVSYSDHLLSVVRLSVNFHIFNFFSKTTGPILTRLSTNHPWG